MMWLPAAITSAITFGIGGFLLKVGSHRNYHRTCMLLGLYFAGTFVFLITLYNSSVFTINLSFLFFSVLVALGSYYGNSFLIKAYELGPSCLTSPLMNISIFFVILLSACVYHEKITSWQYVGIACMIIAVSLLGSNFNNIAIKSKMWWFFVSFSIIFIFMREGGMKIAHETGLNNYGILFFAYLIAGFMAFSKLFFEKHKETALQGITHPTTVKAVSFGAVIGLFSGLGMSFLAYAIARGPASVVVPIFSTRNFVAVLLLVIFFKEKLSTPQWIASGLLLISILFIT